MAQAAVPVPAPPRMSYDEFLERYADARAEWVNGRVELMPAATARHESLRLFLAAVLREYVQLRGEGRVLGEPYNMKLSFQLPGREPDILFVATANLARLGDKFLDGPADLVVEIVSPESKRRDRVVKYGEYERAGVREYWIMDPEKKRADFYVRDSAGVFQAVAPEVDGTYRCAALPGFWLDTAWLWQDPQPTVTEVLEAWGGVEAVRRTA